MSEAIEVLFEARIRLLPEDFEGVDVVANGTKAIEQAVQNLVGSTGAQVVCVFEED